FLAACSAADMGGSGSGKDLCGNGVLDQGEACDTRIATGKIGSCPTTCVATDPCATFELSGTDCDTECVQSIITAAINDDGCCPQGADANTDSDCGASCGNSIVESGENCDIGLSSGPGACPVSCDDSDACTNDTLDNPGTCLAICVHQTITVPHNG